MHHDELDEEQQIFWLCAAYTSRVCGLTLSPEDAEDLLATARSGEILESFTRVGKALKRNRGSYYPEEVLDLVKREIEKIQ